MRSSSGCAPEAMNGVELTDMCKRVTVLADEINEFRRKEAEDKANAAPR